MGAAVIVWNRTQVTALMHASWASSPMTVSGEMLNKMFDQLLRECHADLVLETPEVMFAVKACVDIITIGLGREVFCQLEGWLRLMNTWQDLYVHMTVDEFEENGDETYCICFRAAAIREAWQAEINKYINIYAGGPRGVPSTPSTLLKVCESLQTSMRETCHPQALHSRCSNSGSL
jgi:hypothetical protein